jgi:hypothetical protein
MSLTTASSGPIKFLGGTLLSFNTTLGLGTQESTLTAQVVEDCSDGDSFQPNTGDISVGDPVYFFAGDFKFGGILTNWNLKQSSGGKIFDAKITDPRQILQNTVVVTDSNINYPIRANNYFNVYAYWESTILNGNCSAFGTSGNTGEGMPYQRIIDALVGIDPTVTSSTGYPYTINFNSFPTGVPAFYRIPGPSTTILQLLESVCEVLGLEFYVYLNQGEEINIGYIDLKRIPTSFSDIINTYEGKASEVSYGQTLRNEVTKTMLIGEKVHYLSIVDKFIPYFGQDTYGSEEIPVVPYGYDNNGFWISKRIDELNMSLDKPISSNGPFTISEMDIVVAMGGFKGWLNRTMDPQCPGSFNEIIRNTWSICNVERLKAILNFLGVQNQINLILDNANQSLSKALNNVLPGTAAANKPEILEDLQAIHSWLSNLGNTYYGKQYLSPLNNGICRYLTDYTMNNGQSVYSDEPTSAGGWVDDGTPVLGLNNPELEIFKNDDGRINHLVVFTADGSSPENTGRKSYGRPKKGVDTNQMRGGTNNSNPSADPEA